MKNLTKILILCAFLFVLSACSTENTEMTVFDTVENDFIFESKIMDQEFEDTEFSALELLNCRPDEGGTYRVNQNVLCVVDDYELFRKYFFGT